MIHPRRYVPVFGLAIALLAAPFLFSPTAHATAWEGPPGVHFFAVDAVVFGLLPGFEELTFDTNHFGAVADRESRRHAALTSDIYGHGPLWSGRVKLEEEEGFAAYSQPFHIRA